MLYIIIILCCAADVLAEPVTAAAATSPWWGPAVIGGAAALAGSAWSAFSGSKQAEKQRDWQAEMSNTAHQREVKDLKAAGLNPILSAKLGGSTTPSGAMPQVPDYGNSARSGIEAAQAYADMKVKAATVADINASAQLKNTQALDITSTQQSRIMQALASAQQLLASGNLSDNQTKLVQQQVKNMVQELERLKNETTSSAFQLDRDRAESEFYRGTGGKIAPWMDKVFDKIGIPIPIPHKRR